MWKCMKERGVHIHRERKGETHWTFHRAIGCDLFGKVCRLLETVILKMAVGKTW